MLVARPLLPTCTLLPGRSLAVGRKQRGEIFRADIRCVLEESIERRVAGGYRDDGEMVGSRGRDVGWRVADDDDGGSSACSRAGCCCRRGNHLCPLLVCITEAAEGEVLAQSGALKLEPADGLEVAGGDAEPLAASGEMLKRVDDTGHDGELHAGGVAFYGRADGREQAWLMRTPGLVGDTGSGEGVAEDARICRAGYGDGLK